MKLESEFIRLPFEFEVERLQREVAAFASSDWMPHPQNYSGNYSIPLISVNGELNDNFNGPMQLTEGLKKSPYMQQVIESFGEVFGRSRLMRLDANSVVPPHADINYHWYKRVRIHIPVFTSPEVRFFCGSKSQSMAAGECWLLDTWKKHWVENNSSATRIHLVIDTAGSAEFWAMASRAVESAANREELECKSLAFVPDKKVSITTEQFNAPRVMSPGEVDGLIADLLQDVAARKDNDARQVRQFSQLMSFFALEWRKLWSVHADGDAGLRHYRQLLSSLVLPDLPIMLASNMQPAVRVFQTRVLIAALNEQIKQTG